jgi:hypothetical protein
VNTPEKAVSVPCELGTVTFVVLAAASAAELELASLAVVAAPDAAAAGLVRMFGRTPERQSRDNMIPA